jgi:hypothetical protein
MPQLCLRTTALVDCTDVFKHCPACAFCPNLPSIITEWRGALRREMNRTDQVGGGRVHHCQLRNTSGSALWEGKQVAGEQRRDSSSSSSSSCGSPSRAHTFLGYVTTGT